MRAIREAPRNTGQCLVSIRRGRRPELPEPYRFVQKHFATLGGQAVVAVETELQGQASDEPDALFDGGILDNGSPRSRPGVCGEDKQDTFSSQQRGFCRLCGAQRSAHGN